MRYVKHNEAKPARSGSPYEAAPARVTTISYPGSLWPKTCSFGLRLTITIDAKKESKREKQIDCIDVLGSGSCLRSGFHRRTNWRAATATCN
jgi:hypothetical protein